MRKFDLVVLELHGSGGHIFADVTDEQAKKADLGVGKCFLAPIGKLEAVSYTHLTLPTIYSV